MVECDYIVYFGEHRAPMMFLRSLKSWLSDYIVYFGEHRAPMMFLRSLKSWLSAII